MQNKEIDNGEHFNAFTYLKDVVVSNILDYINRIANIRSEEESATVANFINEIEKEIKTVAVLRKFLILNTNVITTSYSRVLSDSTLQNFYFELMSSIRTQISLELDEGTYDVIRKGFVSTLKSSVFNAETGSQALVQTGSDLNKIAADMAYKAKEVDHFLAKNEWYYGIIFCNYYAPTILDQFGILREAKPAPV